MRILIVNSDPPTTAVSAYTLSLYSALKRLTVTNKHAGEFSVGLYSHKERFYDRMLHSKSLSLDSLGMALRIMGQSVFFAGIPRDPDLYHIAKQTVGITARLLSPCVFTVHDPIDIAFPPPKSYVLLSRLLTRSMENLMYASRIICISKSTKDALMNFCNVNSNILRVIYYGLDHELFKIRPKDDARRMLGLSPDKFYVLSVGSESERKNMPTLIKAFHKLQKEVGDVILIRVGPKTIETQKLVKEYGLNSKVLHFGRVNYERVPYFYNAADVLCFPSYYEGFGFPPLEAMASGCAVVASNKTSIPEVVGEGGILLDPFNADDFAYWMGEVITNADLRAELVSKGLKRSKMFSWEKCAKETLEVYEAVLS